MFEHIIVVGNGKTSRANIEALIDDYIYANPKVKFSLYSTLGVLSEGQGWLKSYLADKEISHESVRELETVSGQKTAVFILWSDEDAENFKFDHEIITNMPIEIYNKEFNCTIGM